MRSVLVLLISFLVCFVSLGAPTRAARAGETVVTVSPSSSRVEVGERFSITLAVTSDEPLGAVSRPTFEVPPGFSVEGPSTSMSTQTRSSGGVRTTKSTARVVFFLTPSRPGKFRIPSPSVAVGGSTLSGRPVEIEVVPASGGALGTGAPGGMPFQLIPTNPFDVDDPLGPDDDSASSKELAMPNGPDEAIFLRAIPDKSKVYVGEQVTLSVYLYYRVAYEMTERSDAKYTDFLRYPLLLDPGSTPAVYTRVGARRYGARLVEKVALIPLKAGTLSTGSMSARFNGRQIGSRVLKRSNDVTIEAVEPPADGRPAGYTLGDVGQFTLTAAVTPRRVEQGGSIGVVVRVEGTGNVPTRIQTPEAKGVEWLAPRVKDAISAKTGRVGGSRTFEYVVRLKNAGKVDLGALELPYFDPAAKRYEVARVALGEVEVDEAAPTPSDVERAKAREGLGDDPLARLPAPRRSLSAFARPDAVDIPTPTLVLGLVVPPALALVVIGLGRARRAVRERRAAGGADIRAKAKDALAQAKRAEKSGDVKEAISCVERAVHGWLEAKTGVRARGLRLGELEPKLVELGADKDIAHEARVLLEECESERYSPAAGIETVRDIVKRAQALGKRLA